MKIAIRREWVRLKGGKGRPGKVWHLTSMDGDGTRCALPTPFMEGRIVAVKMSQEPPKPTCASCLL